MAFQIGSTLLDACVLAVLADGDAYGYRLTQQIREVVEISESTLYPVLRRLQKDGAVNSYDQPYMGRNRRYYRLTGKGLELFAGYKEEWVSFRSRIDGLMMGHSAGCRGAEHTGDTALAELGGVRPAQTPPGAGTDGERMGSVNDEV